MDHQSGGNYRLGINPGRDGKYLSKDKYISLRIFCAELFGTALFLYFGDATIAQVLVGRYVRVGARGLDQENEKVAGTRLNATELANEFDYGDFLTIAIGYGLGLTMGIVVSGAVSGGHLNPAITITEVVFKRLPTTILPVYVISQFFGSFIGMGFVHTVHSFKLADLRSVGVDVTPIYYTSRVLPTVDDDLTLVWDQFVGSSIYMFVYLSMDDRFTGIKSKPLRVIILGSTYTVLLLATGINSGTALNPARDFVPRIFAYLIGHQSAFEGFCAIPLLIPIMGSLFGSLVYELTIRCLKPEEVANEEKSLMEDVMKNLEELEGTVRTLRSHNNTANTPIPTSTSLDDTTHLSGLASPEAWRSPPPPRSPVAMSPPQTPPVSEGARRREKASMDTGRLDEEKHRDKVHYPRYAAASTTEGSLPDVETGKAQKSKTKSKKKEEKEAKKGEEGAKKGETEVPTTTGDTATGGDTGTAGETGTAGDTGDTGTAGDTTVPKRETKKSSVTKTPVMESSQSSVS